MFPDLQARKAAWLNWLIVLGLGPCIAMLLARLAGYPGDQETLKVILLAEAALVAAGVMVLLLVQALGPVRPEDWAMTRGMEVPKPQPGSLLEEVTVHSHSWESQIQTHLRNAYRDFSVTRKESEPEPLLSPPTSLVASDPRRRPLQAPSAAAGSPESSRRPHQAQRPQQAQAPAQHQGHSQQRDANGRRRPPQRGSQR